MNEEQYQSICGACDRVLVAPDSTLERMAIPWLHVLSEHPVVLRHYTGIVAGSPGDPMLGVKSGLSQIGGLARDVGLRRIGEPPLKRADLMFVSHLLNETQIGGREDFYFGRLPEELKQEGLSSCVVLINHAGVKSRRRAEWASDLAPRSVLARRLSVRQELGLRRRLGREARRLRDGRARRGDPLQYRVYAEAGRQAVSGSALDTLRIYEQLRTYLARVRPKVVVATYEGHAWERLLFAAARQEVPRALCIGYHHTILFPRQHAAFRLLGSHYDPDIVLTAGDITRDRFRRAFASTDIRVSTLGTHRRQTSAVDPAPGEPPSARLACCLVLPDGIISEVQYLFDFAIAAAALAPQLRFILRLHPLISRKSLQRRFPRLQALLPNVELSDQTLADDLRRSRWALYRGSGAAVQAVIAGVRPLYVDKPGELSIDCLSGLQAWKRVVTAPQEFVEIAGFNLQGDAANTLQEAAAAAEYCRKYFMPANPRVMAEAVRETLTLNA